MPISFDGSAQGKRQKLKINVHRVASVYLKGLFLFGLLHSASFMSYRFNSLGHILIVRYEKKKKRNVPLTK